MEGNFDALDSNGFRPCNLTAGFHHQRKSRANSLELLSETDNCSFTYSDFNDVLNLLSTPSDGDQSADDTNDTSLDCVEPAESNRADDDFAGKTDHSADDTHSFTAVSNTINDDSKNTDLDVAVKFKYSSQVESDNADDDRKTIDLNQAGPIYPILEDSKPVKNQNEFIHGLSALLDLHLLIDDYYDLVFTSCLFFNMNGTDDQQYHLQRMSLLKSIKKI